MDNDQLEFNENVPGMLPIFVGRAIEITRLNHILQEVKNYKQPRFVLIQGDFGIGKTSLVENFIKEVIDKDSSILFGRGNCSMETELNGLTPFIQLLAGLGETAIKKRVIKDNLVNFVKETAPAWLDVVSGGIFSAVIKTVEVGGKVLGFKRNQSNIQETKFIQLQTAFETIAKNNVVVAFIDDIHWADATSLDLLFYLSRNLSNVSIMIICTYRPVEAMQTGRNARFFSQIRSELIRYNVLEIILDQGIDVAEYLRKRFPFNNFPKSAVDNLQQITDGHALFVSQLVSLWVETGIIHSQKTRRGNQLWSINSKAFSYLAVPTSLSQVLDERLQRIQEELRNVLVCASVEGDNFTVQVIEQLCRLDERKTSDDLETLERRYLLLKELEPRLEDERLLNFYKFIHRFIRRHIYHQISDGKRRRLHKEVGDCLEVLHKDQRKISGQLTLHYKEAMEGKTRLNTVFRLSEYERNPNGIRWAKNGIR